MPNVLTTDEFLNAPGVMLDVRSPAEYNHAHIPGAVSFPLFSNEERAQVGTCYKQRGRDAAVELGLQLVGPKLAAFVQQAKQLARDRVLRIHCWRGGMRSGSMAWLMQTAGFRVSVLDKGYKGFRQWVRDTLAVEKPVLILGGMTGSGKTAVLHKLAQQGAQILDLEALANHRGSSYGALGLPPQPSTEQFENLIAMEWAAFDATHPVWIEAESRMIGTCRIPDELFHQMMQAPVLQLERSRAERVAILLNEYGVANREDLINATNRIARRIGGQHANAAIEYIRQGNLVPAIEIVLDYYDKTYRYDLQKRSVTIHPVDAVNSTDAEAARRLKQRALELTLTRLAIAQKPIKV
ncbi:MAG: tRNA 2-selenouridine(34) synthase MnmH [Oscillatoriales cyanobacterium C42_A2020_001]|nr:tRNA 2-selenouridine(34) synthase MnmH [Leptolyngbyaceae cyanobacterium C42_A2020_001]